MNVRCFCFEFWNASLNFKMVRMFLESDLQQTVWFCVQISGIYSKSILSKQSEIRILNVVYILFLDFFSFLVSSIILIGRRRRNSSEVCNISKESRSKRWPMIEKRCICNQCHFRKWRKMVLFLTCSCTGEAKVVGDGRWANLFTFNIFVLFVIQLARCLLGRRFQLASENHGLKWTVYLTGYDIKIAYIFIKSLWTIRKIFTIFLPIASDLLPSHMDLIWLELCDRDTFSSASNRSAAGWECEKM